MIQVVPGGRTVPPRVLPCFAHLSMNAARVLSAAGVVHLREGCAVWAGRSPSVLRIGLELLDGAAVYSVRSTIEAAGGRERCSDSSITCRGRLERLQVNPAKTL